MTFTVHDEIIAGPEREIAAAATRGGEGVAADQDRRGHQRGDHCPQHGRKQRAPPARRGSRGETCRTHRKYLLVARPGVTLCDVLNS
jgi:hypothetical protein